MRARCEEVDAQSHQFQVSLVTWSFAKVKLPMLSSATVLWERGMNNDGNSVYCYSPRKLYIYSRILR